MKIQNYNSVKKIYSVNNKPVITNHVSQSSFGSAKVAEPVMTDIVDTVYKEKAEEIAKYKEEIEKQKEQQAQMEAELEQLKADFEASKKEAEAVKEAFDVFIKCIRISGNIISGHKVPASDHNFLMDNDPELYMLSVSARMPNDDPKEVVKVHKEKKDTEALELELAETAQIEFSPSQSSSEAPSTESAEPTPAE